MAIRFVCRCGKKLKAAETKVGTKVLCPACGQPVLVPDADRESSDERFTSTAQIAGGLLHVTEEDKKPGSAGFDRRVSTSGIDIGATIAYFAAKFVPGLVIVGLITWVVYWASSQLFESVSEKPPLAIVTGQVTLDDKPLPGATVLFQPERGDEAGVNVAASVGRTDRSGHFELNYVRNVKGAAVGKHKVEIRAPGLNGVERVPAWYNTNTELTRIVKPGEDNEFYFRLKSTR